MSYENELKKVGLTDDQAKIYETLLSAPLLPARIISKNSGVGRELAYIALGQLIEIGLVEKVKQNSKIALFRAIHPREIEHMVSAKEKTALEAKEAYEKILQHMTRDYNSVYNRPHVKFYEGIEGLKETNAEVLKGPKNVYILRSLFDHENKEISEIISEQIKKQSQSGIHSYVLSPKLPHMSDISHKHNLERNITRKILPKEKLTLPAQVVILGNKVSITSFRKQMMTTIIENEDIAETFRVLFNYLWDSVE